MRCSMLSVLIVSVLIISQLIVSMRRGGVGVAPGRARAKVMCVRRTCRQIFFA